LTPLGVKQAAHVARWLASRLADDCRILVSPALRAQQTAQALARTFETDPRLASGSTADAVIAATNWPDASTCVLAVGHQPTLGHVASLLLEGEAADRALRTGEVLWVRGRAGDAHATLVDSTAR
jgi:phosphohistidine phosphatase